MLKDTLIKLVSIPGPSGFEDACAAYIAEEMKPYADEIKKDVMGNLICVKKGKGGKKIMIAAHMDQIGFMVTAIEKDGFLRVTNIGGVSPVNMQAQHVVMKSGAKGIVFTEAGNEKAMFIDIGAESAEEAEKLASVGDWAIIDGVVTEMGSRISAPYMDDRCGCAVLMETMRNLKDTDNEVVAVFTTQEEVGLRGATTAGYAVDPDMAIALDVTLAQDVPSVRKTAYVVSSLGKGAAIKVMDRGIIAHPTVVAAMKEAAEKGNIPYQMEVLTAGSTDVGAIHKGRSGVAAGCISIPCRYVHAPCETIDLRDLQGAVDILLNLL